MQSATETLTLHINATNAQTSAIAVWEILLQMRYAATLEIACPGNAAVRQVLTQGHTM